MYLHKENKELFKDVIQLTSERLHVTEDIVEKDYYITMILSVLSKTDYPVVFKGGTSLSKAFGVIDRFSEDIDITFTEHLGANKRKRLKYEVLWPISEDLGLEIRNWDAIESDRDYNHYDYYYQSMQPNPLGNLPSYVKIETALMSSAFPLVEKEIDNYIYRALSKEEPELMKKCGLIPFTMKVQTLERTLIDKIFALCDYYIINRANRNSRHLYDVYLLSKLVTKDEAFRNLLLQVREHRKCMNERIAPSARDNIDMKVIIQKICKEDFYRQDYQDNTIRLISDDIDYVTVRDFYKVFTDDLF